MSPVQFPEGGATGSVLSDPSSAVTQMMTNFTWRGDATKAQLYAEAVGYLSSMPERSRAGASEMEYDLAYHQERAQEAEKYLDSVATGAATQTSFTRGKVIL